MEDSKGLLVPGASRRETRTTRWHEQPTRSDAAGAAAATMDVYREAVGGRR